MIKDLALFLGVAIGTVVGLKVISSSAMVQTGLVLATSYGLSKFGHKGLAIPVLVGGAGTVAGAVLDTVGGKLSSVNPSVNTGVALNLQSEDLQVGTNLGEYTLYTSDTPGHRG